MSQQDQPTPIVAETIVIGGREYARRVASLIRGVLVFLGALAIVVGVIVLIFPDQSLVLLAVLIGIFFLVSGLVRLIAGILAVHRSTTIRVLNVIAGALLVIGGVLVIIHPVAGVWALALLIGLTWILEGATTLWNLPLGPARGWAVAGGIVSALAGIAVLFLPGIAAVVMLVVAACALIVVGVVSIIAGVVFVPRVPRGPRVIAG